MFVIDRKCGSTTSVIEQLVVAMECHCGNDVSVDSNYYLQNERQLVTEWFEQCLELATISYKIAKIKEVFLLGMV